MAPFGENASENDLDPPPGSRAAQVEARALPQDQRLSTMAELARMSDLISTLAHEMRTPLTSIKGYSTALLMEDVTFSPETQRASE